MQLLGDGTEQAPQGPFCLVIAAVSVPGPQDVEQGPHCQVHGVVSHGGGLLRRLRTRKLKKVIKDCKREEAGAYFCIFC